ncbi:DUF4177 domain-containing protein [Virgibacillus halophilus]|uniref:DUF4177 domain-containing protein n=1 Tax=Tigheibacillus halophilus TaxID=361280 RepID=A0ABU5C935_9BACI|nr:DUF4177 domain-containing protein [Virgibacillus halophilus]
MQWEYKVVAWKNAMLDVDSGELEELLNEHGKSGWELVNIIPQIGSYAGNVTTNFNQIVFKRVKD